MYSNFCDENHAYYLAHYGVPGMKWRVHRGRNRAFDTRTLGRRRRPFSSKPSDDDSGMSWSRRDQNRGIDERDRANRRRRAGYDNSPNPAYSTGYGRSADRYKDEQRTNENSRRRAAEEARRDYEYRSRQSHEAQRRADNARSGRSSTWDEANARTYQRRTDHAGAQRMNRAYQNRELDRKRRRGGR